MALSLPSFAAGPEGVQSKGKPLSIVAGGSAGFTLLSPENTGIRFTNTLAEERAATNRTLYNGSGVAAGDIDGDGKVDLVFAGVENRLEVFKNLGNWSFTNWTAKSGIAVSNLTCRGVVLADLDGNNTLDLLATANGRGVLCWSNDGKGRFTDITKEARTANPYGAMTMALADVDGNGTLDLYVANNRSDDIRDRGEVQLSVVGGKPTVPSFLRNRIVIHRGQILEFGEPDFLLLNNGRGQFTPLSWTNGMFLDERGQRLPGAPLDWGLTATFRDLNGDLAPDLYVCNDFWTPDQIWMNNGKGSFRASPTLSFRQTSASSMGVDMTDLDFDGAPEIFVLDMLSRSPASRRRQMDAQQSSPNLPGLFQDRPQILRNTLFLARGDGTYAELANYSGVAASEWAWQPMFVDIDLDGHQDLLVTTGHARDVQDRDANVQIRARQKNYQAITNPEERRKVYQADLLAHMRLYPELRTPIIAYRNQGNLKFEDLTDRWGTEENGIHHGIAMADLDGDGDLDFAVNNLNAPASIYRNNSAAPRVTVRLIGIPPNSQAIGAQVTLRNGAIPIQQQEVVSGGRYLSGSDPLLVFAAGTSKSGMSLEIRWRNGTLTTLRDVRADHQYELDEKAGAASQNPTAPKIAATNLFSDVSAKLNHSHHEAPFDDFTRQPLLPHRLSQAGPGLCWTDLDGDGWEDLIVGTGAGGFLGAFRNDQTGGFQRWTNAPFHQRLARDTTAIISVPALNGKAGLIAGLANYEDGRTNTAAAFRFDVQAGTAVAALPDLQASIGPIAAADYDADGDLDIFIGSRVIPGRWPEASDSMLLQNERGVWNPRTLKVSQSGPRTPVTAAVWSDLDSDGFSDLVVAGEFSPIQIFRNTRGELSPLEGMVRTEAGENVPLSELTGWWTSLNAGDFDGDGQMDLVAGNWGENSEYQATRSQPLQLVTGQFGTPQTAVIETVFDPGTKTYVPTRSLDDYLPHLPHLFGRFASHSAYSTNSVTSVLGSSNRFAVTWRITELRSVLLLNRTNHFELRPLPKEAQFAPTFGTAISDFDLDGNEDIFLGQNFFAMRTGVPRLDAGRGLLLLGDGTGNFKPVSADRSGISVYGEQRGVATADYNHDGRPDLVVSQNGAETKLYRNDSSRAGLRVRIVGPAGNPEGIGTVIRTKTGHKFGPSREIHSGSGYWSQDSAIEILAISTSDDRANWELEVQWPGGRRRLINFPHTLRELRVDY